MSHYQQKWVHNRSFCYIGAEENFTKSVKKYLKRLIIYYTLNGVFFHDLELADPEVYLNAVGSDLGETMGNIIAESYKLMAAIKPEAVLVLGDTNSCLSVIGAKRLHIPIFHMEAGNRCKDECLPEESSFFTSVGHPFPAVCIRTSTERPEALDKGCFVLAGIDEKSLLQAVDTAVQMNLDGDDGRCLIM